LHVDTEGIELMARNYKHRKREARISPNRYFYVLGEGWYVFTREGISGPYIEKDAAIDFVETVLTGDRSFETPSFMI
jgi:hypothetical protein